MLSSPTLRKAVAAALTDRRGLVVDLTDVQFLGTSGLAALVEARSAARRAGAELWLACAHRAVVRPLRIAGLVELFQIADTVEAALRALADPARGAASAAVSPVDPPGDPRSGII
jgi:anti-sigma B factor antagonist